MTGRLAVLWAFVAAAAASALVPAWLAARAASTGAARAARDLVATASLADRMSTLESELPPWATTGAAAGSDRETVAQTAARLLAEVGLPTSALSSLSPESATAIGGGNLPEASRPRRVRHTAAVEPITLVQLGRLLEKWRVARPEWVVTAIEIVPIRAGFDAKAVRKGTPLRVTLSVEAVRAGPGTTSR